MSLLPPPEALYPDPNTALRVYHGLKARADSITASISTTSFATKRMNLSKENI
jgi:hypothetical protein